MQPPTAPPPAGPPPPRWGEPGYTPPAGPPRKPSGGRIAFAVTIAVVGLIAAVNLASPDETATTGTQATDATDAPAVADLAEPAETTPEPTKPAGPATARIGETIAFEDSFGDHAIDVTVARKKVSTGSEFDRPDHGLYVGFEVRAKAFKNGISIPDFYVLEGGRRYEATIAFEGFRPDLRTYGELNKGEGTGGWVVFDVPARTGKLVMKEFLSDEPQAIWTF
jgi:hypothetical protein